MYDRVYWTSWKMVQARRYDDLVQEVKSDEKGRPKHL